MSDPFDLKNAILSSARSSSTTVDIPATFWDDHDSRDLSDGCSVIKRLARTVRVEMTDAALAELRSDAEYYASEFRNDPDYSGIASSAAATVRALDREAQR